MQADWDETDESRARDALRRNYGKFPELGAMWPTSTARDWAGSKKGLSVLDTRGPIKNNAEYHGLETYAWQYLVTVQYELAADHFYIAALWRGMDAEAIGQTDGGHARAEALCLRCARFAYSLAHAPAGRRPVPEEFGLESDWVEEREAKAQRVLDEMFDS